MQRLCQTLPNCEQPSMRLFMQAVIWQGTCSIIFIAIYCYILLFIIYCYILIFIATITTVFTKCISINLHIHTFLGRTKRHSSKVLNSILERGGTSLHIQLIKTWPPTTESANITFHSLAFHTTRDARHIDTWTTQRL